MVDGANFIDGRWVPAASGSTFQRCNPADPDDVVGTFPASGPADVRAAVDALDKAAPEWADVAPERRAAILESAAAQLESSSTVLIAELVREEGKTTAEATMEVSRTPANLRFYAGEATRTTGSTYPAAGANLVFTLREPVGIVGAITPWNFPLNIPSRKLGPALAAGNPVLFKPSEVTPLMGQRLVEALLAGGLPPNAIALVQGDGTVGAAVAQDPRVTAVTFTGSTRVGRLIHSQVGPDRRVQLEMGGKNPVVVADDVDIDAAAALIVKGAFGLSARRAPGPAASSQWTRSTTNWSSGWSRRPKRCGSVRGPSPGSTWGRWPAPRNSRSSWIMSVSAWRRAPRCAAGAPPSAIVASSSGPPCSATRGRRCALFVKKYSGR